MGYSPERKSAVLKRMMPPHTIATCQIQGNRNLRWQIKHNIAVSRLASAQRWAGYLVNQGKRHLIVPRIKGKVIGVPRSIHYTPVEAQRAALEAWKHDVGEL